MRMEMKIRIVPTITAGLINHLTFLAGNKCQITNLFNVKWNGKQANSILICTKWNESSKAILFIEIDASFLLLLLFL